MWPRLNDGLTETSRAVSFSRITCFWLQSRAPLTQSQRIFPSLPNSARRLRQTLHRRDRDRGPAVSRGACTHTCPLLPHAAAWGSPSCSLPEAAASTHVRGPGVALALAACRLGAGSVSSWLFPRVTVLPPGASIPLLLYCRVFSFRPGSRCSAWTHPAPEDSSPVVPTSACRTWPLRAWRGTSPPPPPACSGCRTPTRCCLGGPTTNLPTWTSLPRQYLYKFCVFFNLPVSFRACCLFLILSYF